MGQRNINEQVQGYHCPEPCFLLGGRTNFPQSNLHTLSRASGSNHDLHNIPEDYEGAMFYERMQYNGFHDPHPAVNLELGVATGSNFCNSYFTPASGPGMISVPLNQGSIDQLTSSSNSGVIGVSSDEYHFMDGIGASKRKNAEGLLGTFQYYNPAEGPSSSASVPFNARHIDGVAMMDAASSAPRQYRGNGTSSVIETMSQRSTMNRLAATRMDPFQAHTRNPLLQGNYVAPPFQPAGTHWLDQQSSSNCSNTSASAWTQTPTVPYMHGYIDSGNMGAHSYHETAGNRSSTSLLNPPVTNHHHYIHHPPPHMQAMGGHNINFYPHVAAAPFHVPTNNASRNILSTSQDGWEREQRHRGAVLPTGFSIYRSHQEGHMHEPSMTYRDLSHLRVIPADDVAILDGPDFYEAETFIDHHRDMRLDIEDMSYEELLALGERIGNVNTGLTEEIIVNQLKTRSYSVSALSINLEEVACEEQEPDSCIICQTDYRNQEPIGTLVCGHEYHADCLKNWLLVKNVCPVCKCEAITTKTKDV